MKSAVLKATSVIKKICYYICFLSMALVVCMMLLMFVDAVLGLFFNSRITGSYELVQCMLCIVVRFFFVGFTALLSTFTMGFATYSLFGIIASKKLSGECTGTLLIPYWPFYVVELIAFAVFTLALLCDTIKAFMAMGDKETAEDVMKSWS